MHWGAFALATGLALLSAACLVSLLRLERTLDRLLGVFVLFVAQVQVSLLVAGLFVRALEPGPVLAINAAIAAPVAVLTLRRAALPRPRLDPRRLWGRSSSAVIRHPWEVLLLAMAAAGLLWRGILAYVLPPYGYDAISYHLPTVVTWIQEQGIVVSDLSRNSGRFPPGGELLFTWPALFLEDIVYADTVQVGFAAAGAIAVGGIARTAGFSRPAAYVAGALFALTPIVLAQANTAYVDVVFASGFLLALYFIHRYLAGDRSTPLLLLAGLAAAIVVGSKPNGVLAGMVLVVTIGGFLLWMGRNGRLPAGAWRAMVVAFVTPMVLLGGWAYLRNWIEVGNPVSPAEVRVLGVEVFRGTPAEELIEDPPSGLRRRGAPLAPIASWAHDLAFWNQASYRYDERGGGLGPAWSWLGAPLLLALLVAAFKRDRVLLLGVLAPILVVCLLGPYGWWARFTILLAAAGGLAIARFWQARGSRFLELSLRVAVVGLAASGLWIASVRIDPRLDQRTQRPASILRLVGEPRSERSFGRVWDPDVAWLDSVPDSALIAFGANMPIISTLAGPNLQRRVERLPTEEDEIEAFVDERGVEYVFVRIGSPADRWARRHPRLTRVISPGRAFRSYRVRPIR
jgi:hypothetical protein